MSWYSFAPYVSVAQRKANAQRELAKLERKTGRRPDPVVLDGKKIAATFWGKAWCDHLESYGDFANRLPRGRTYVRNGSVCDLSVKPGEVSARVCGSELYDVTVTVKPLAAAKWAAVKRACAGQIGSLVELLKGRLSAEVMKVVTDRSDGLFPAPRELEMDCSCPDYATMCKHVAAALYGIGARLDRQPELLFTLRGVDHLELIAEAGKAPAVAGDKAGRSGGKNRLAAGVLADVFGIEMDDGTPVTSVKVPEAIKVRSVGDAEISKMSAAKKVAPAKRLSRTTSKVPPVFRTPATAAGGTEKAKRGGAVAKANGKSSRPASSATAKKKGATATKPARTPKPKPKRTTGREITAKGKRPGTADRKVPTRT